MIKYLEVLSHVFSCICLDVIKILKIQLLIQNSKQYMKYGLIILSTYYHTKFQAEI